MRCLLHSNLRIAVLCLRPTTRSSVCALAASAGATMRSRSSHHCGSPHSRTARSSSIGTPSASRHPGVLSWKRLQCRRPAPVGVWTCAVGRLASPSFEWSLKAVYSTERSHPSQSDRLHDRLQPPVSQPLPLRPLPLRPLPLRYMPGHHLVLRPIRGCPQVTSE